MNLNEQNEQTMIPAILRPGEKIHVMSGDVIVKVIPETVDLEQVAYELKDRSLVVTDGGAWSMEVKEFGWG